MKHIVFSICMGLASMLIFTGCSGIKELNSAMADATLSDNVSANDIKIIRNKTTKNEVMNVIGAPSLVFRIPYTGSLLCCIPLQSSHFEQRSRRCRCWCFCRSFFKPGKLQERRSCYEIQQKRMCPQLRVHSHQFLI